MTHSVVQTALSKTNKMVEQSHMLVEPPNTSINLVPENFVFNFAYQTVFLKTLVLSDVAFNK